MNDVSFTKEKIMETPDDWIVYRTCTRKRRYPNRNRANRAAEAAELICDCGRPIESYLCPFSKDPHYHIGHPSVEERLEMAA